MRLPRLTTSFSAYSDANLETKAQAILASMTGNLYFPDPVPNIAELQTAITNYSNALIAAASLGRDNVASKNACRKLLVTALVQLAAYVTYAANGNETALISSGFTLAKNPEPRYITNPGSVTLSNGVTAGQLVSSVPRVNGASSYLHEICAEQPTEQTVWTSNASSRSQFVFKGLLPGKKYWVRVGALGSGDQLAYSPVASQFAQ